MRVSESPMRQFAYPASHLSSREIARKSRKLFSAWPKLFLPGGELLKCPKSVSQLSSTIPPGSERVRAPNVRLT